jgi:hypothetical protein
MAWDIGLSRGNAHAPTTFRGVSPRLTSMVKHSRVNSSTSRNRTQTSSVECLIHHTVITTNPVLAVGALARAAVLTHAETPSFPLGL